MEPPILLHLTIGLIAWALMSLGTAVAGLYFQPGKNAECWRGFWFMNGIWGLIDGAIGWANLITGPVEMDFLRMVLAINSGLDLAYIATGIILATIGFTGLFRILDKSVDTVKETSSRLAR